VTAVLRTYTRGIVGKPQRATSAALVLLAALLVLLAGRLEPFPSMLRGWLLAFAIWSCAPIGSMVLLLIHSLTGGRWGHAAGPVLRPLAAMMPLAAIAFIPVLASLPHIYPWAADPGQIQPDVARWYLSYPAFIVRAFIALVGWSVLGVTFAAGAGGRLLAALGLAFFGLMISLVAVDWYLSIDPHYVATAFASMIAIQQLLVALAVTAVIGLPEVDGPAVGDIAGLLIATLLGVVYLEYMTFVVAWYGDLPEKAAWFLARSHLAWRVTLMTALAVGAVLPFGMLLLPAVRSSRIGLRIVGVLLLAGTAMHLAWVIVPAWPAQGSVAAAGLAAFIVLTGASALFARGEACAEANHAE
jgi:hypothetical protein